MDIRVCLITIVFVNVFQLDVFANPTASTMPTDTTQVNATTITVTSSTLSATTMPTATLTLLVTTTPPSTVTGTISAAPTISPVSAIPTQSTILLSALFSPVVHAATSTRTLTQTTLSEEVTSSSKTPTTKKVPIRQGVNMKRVKDRINLKTMAMSDDTFDYDLRHVDNTKNSNKKYKTKVKMLIPKKDGKISKQKLINDMLGKQIIKSHDFENVKPKTRTFGNLFGINPLANPFQFLNTGRNTLHIITIYRKRFPFFVDPVYYYDTDYAYYDGYDYGNDYTNNRKAELFFTSSSSTTEATTTEAQR